MKGCLRLTFVLLAVFGLIGLGAFKLFQNLASSVENFPEYAKRDVVYAQYGLLIADVNEAIEAAESMHDLAARLEKLTVPDELLYLMLTKQTSDSFQKEKIEIVERINVRSSGYTLVDDTGHGTLNDLPVIVIKLPVDRHSIEDCFIYLRREPYRNTPHPEPVEPIGRAQAESVA